MQHSFMPGDKVEYKGNKAQVISRGATRKTYFVEIRFFSDGKEKRLENEDINKLKKV